MSLSHFVSSLATSSVGIRGIEFYFPRNYVSQKELEEFDGVGNGKYTSGLGQLEMAFCGDNEDVCSLAMTVTSALLQNYKVDPFSVGYLAVGTETLIDKSKSVKSSLMGLFSGNANIQGADVKNACYGGTEALFGAVDWLNANHAYDGGVNHSRMAVVVCVDIAVYASGPARCTGGAGAIAFLLDVDAPVVVELGLRAHYSSNRYDFYKPVSGVQSACEYPIVDGSCSIDCYLTAACESYASLRAAGRQNFKRDFSLNDFHATLFHSPFTKLTQKALAALAFIDFVDGSSSILSDSDNDTPLTNGHLNDNNSDGVASNGSNNNNVTTIHSEKLEKLRHSNKSEWFSRESLAIMVAVAQPLITSKLEPYVEFCRRLGNMYTPSLYAQLAGLFHKSVDASSVDGKRVLMFSYGSGCIASMFSLRFDLSDATRRNHYKQIRTSIAQAHARLDQRVKFAPDDYARTLELRERLIRSDPPYTPIWSSTLKVGQPAADATTETDGRKVVAVAPFPDTFYLTHIDSKYRRFYAQTPSLTKHE